MRGGMPAWQDVPGKGPWGTSEGVKGSILQVGEGVERFPAAQLLGFILIRDPVGGGGQLQHGPLRLQQWLLGAPLVLRHRGQGCGGLRGSSCGRCRPGGWLRAGVDGEVVVQVVVLWQGEDISPGHCRRGQVSLREPQVSPHRVWVLPAPWHQAGCRKNPAQQHPSAKSQPCHPPADTGVCREEPVLVAWDAVGNPEVPEASGRSSGGRRGRYLWFCRRWSSRCSSSGSTRRGCHTGTSAAS